MLRVSRYDFVVVLNLFIEVIFLMYGGKSFQLQQQPLQELSSADIRNDQTNYLSLN